MLKRIFAVVAVLLMAGCAARGFDREHFASSCPRGTAAHNEF
jgi:hypothetical protein